MRDMIFVPIWFLNSVKWKYWNDPCCKNEILAYMVTSLINERFVLVPQSLCETWYVNLFCFVFGKMKVLEWPLSRKWVFGLYYKFDKWEVWTCLLMSLDMKHYMWTYLVLYSVKWKYWNDPCRKNEILAYVVRSLINMKVEFVPRCPLMRNMICEAIWFRIG